MTVQRDWAEDKEHENGNYQCRCMFCEHWFIGHKRRVVCKQCAETPAEDIAQAVQTDE